MSQPAIGAAPPTQIRSRVILWFGVVIFARLYTVVLCDFLGRVLGFDWICLTWFENIPSYLWVELIFYGPMVWFSLHQINSDVFGDPPDDVTAQRTHRRRRLTGTCASAAFLYGVGVHATDTLEVLSRERGEGTDGAAAELIHFLDEGLSHYIQFISLFFVIGWFVLFDRTNRIDGARIALFFGVAHGVERTVGIIEGEKWFTGPVVVLWLATAAGVRWQRVGREASREFFFRYAVAFVFTMPLCLVAYQLWFGAFTPPSELTDDEYLQLAVGVAAAVLGGTGAVLKAGRMLHRHWVEAS